ncbi:hypothetical protein [Actinophytocola gossypii]|uniref:Uncharacterized protein n=1 Tax=Actinophytocola gossypii TaxID=2812003 RepID=A0ABT2JC63_9PSEU|nr:hypothetical protein [Actinophytocola gossypii]MCT2585333.1 hypothetical protein [Actinophytocola gossypii]
MNTTPEMVRAEMDYRLERAVSGVALEHLRAARALHRPWWRRRTDWVADNSLPTPSDQGNAVRRAA